MGNDLRFSIADLRLERRENGMRFQSQTAIRKLQILLPLDFMHRMAAEARAVLLNLDLLRATGHLDFGAVVQVAGLGALQPDHFTIFFCHNITTVNLSFSPR